MSKGDFIVNLIDNILDFFQLIKDYLDDALRVFEKIKEVILDIIDSFTNMIDDSNSYESILVGNEEKEDDYFFI